MSVSVSASPLNSPHKTRPPPSLPPPPHSSPPLISSTSIQHHPHTIAHAHHHHVYDTGVRCGCCCCCCVACYVCVTCSSRHNSICRIHVCKRVMPCMWHRHRHVRMRGKWRRKRGTESVLDDMHVHERHVACQCQHHVSCHMRAMRCDAIWCDVM